VLEIGCNHVAIAKSEASQPLACAAKIIKACRCYQLSRILPSRCSQYAINLRSTGEHQGIMFMATLYQSDIMLLPSKYEIDGK
jgi:hypothetical protein